MTRFAALAALLATSLIGSSYTAAAKPVHQDPPGDHSGFYFGARAGYGKNDSVNHYVDDSPTTSTVDENAHGGLISLVFGGDCHITENLIIGAFADLELSNFHRGNFDRHNALTIDRSIYLGGRLGILFSRDTLGFVSGGYTRAHFDNEGWWNILANGVGPVLPGAQDHWFHGWFIGGGFEQRINQRFFLSGELRYAEYATRVTNSGNYLGTNYVDKETPEIVTARLGIIYRIDQESDDGVIDEVFIKTISYSGVDVTSDVWAAYSGLLFALNGDFTRPGVIFRSEGIYAEYDYTGEAYGGSGLVLHEAEDRSLDIMLGYMFYFDTVAVITYVGYEIRDIDLTPEDKTNSARGTQDGIKLAVEIEKEDQTQLYYSFDGSYSNAFHVIYGEGRIGFNGQTFIFGPEGGFLRDNGSWTYRAGIFAKLPFQLTSDIYSQLTLNTGYQWVEETNTGNSTFAGGRGGGEGAYIGTMIQFNY